MRERERAAARARERESHGWNKAQTPELGARKVARGPLHDPSETCVVGGSEQVYTQAPQGFGKGTGASAGFLHNNKGPARGRAPP